MILFRSPTLSLPKALTLAFKFLVVGATMLPPMTFAAGDQKSTASADRRTADTSQTTPAVRSPASIPVTTPVPADHAERATRGLALFKSRIKNLLIEKCLACHGGDATEGKFSLADRSNLVRGGATGLVVQFTDVDQSLLLNLVRHRREPVMPQDAQRLTDEEIGVLQNWLADGAPYDGPLVDQAGSDAPWTERSPTPDALTHWAYSRLTATAVPGDPTVGNGNAIDAFLRVNMRANQLEPAERAAKHTLIRRLFLDLLGVPPTPGELDDFLSDKNPDAFTALVDRTLNDSRFGERYARHWLDVARFAESHGFEQDYDRPFAYHYRDFVIRAFNNDLPFDTFVRWQLAGDEFAPAEPQAMMATGFLGAGVFPTQITANEVERTRYDALDDMAATTGTAFLGLTIGCARCHDHKFDAIPQADYYRILATFTTTVRSNVVLNLVPEPAEPTDHRGVAADEKHQQASSRTRSADPLIAPRPLEVMVTSEGVTPIRHHTQGADFFPETYFLKRGDCEQKEGIAKQGFLQSLTHHPDGVKHWAVKPPHSASTSYQRAALANWLTDTEHGAGQLVARVIVNRLWQHHFGEGLVATPNDFGTQGARPSHPELLDWLAGRLIAENWRLKPIHRLILTSNAYQQTSRTTARAAEVDPANQWHSHFSPRRLEAEALRDSVLAVTGTLDSRMYGPGSLDEHHHRRSIYFRIKRSQLIGSMQVFDAPETQFERGQSGIDNGGTAGFVFSEQFACPGFRGAVRAQIRWGGNACCHRPDLPHDFEPGGRFPASGKGPFDS